HGNSHNGNSEYLTIEIKAGVPVKLNSESLTGSEILKKLNVIGSKFSIGKEIYTGDCIIGIKGRILFEAPGIFILMKAWKKVTQYVLTKQQLSFFRFSSEKWGDLVYSGLYFEPLCRDLECMIDNSFKNITGTVKIKLSDNNFEVVEVKTPLSLFNSDVAVYAQKSKWTNEVTDGFIKLHTLQQNISGSR
ncbi:MAG: argininosuccinate synthase, partial [Bacteroidetes bacterium]|nr:argininosuccinate synthase [Bacteroidota bacterium]